MEINGINPIDKLNNKASDSAAKISSSSFSSYLGESASLSQIFEKAANTYGVDVNLLKAIGKQESNFNPNAVSRCGAQGIMQLMPATAASLGVTDSFDAEQNIMGGAKYISQLLNEYNGNTTFALAAYNAGGNNVNKYGGVPPFKETQEYVVKVSAYMQNGVEVPNETYKSSSGSSLPNDSGTKESGIPDELLDAMKELESLFTYDDYMKFINLFINNKDLSKTEEGENTENKQDNSVYSALSQITYSPAVLNLLSSV